MRSKLFRRLRGARLKPRLTSGFSGQVWGITCQGARKKWPDAVTRPAPPAARTSSLEVFDGTAELVQVPSGGWNWTGKGADGASGAAGDGACHATAEEAAAHAGAFLKEHVADAVDRT